ncbi:MAG: sigma-54-dependent Fis family transcriptional regulator [Desulfatiglans sp.]|nr:sigma-54-dependent Fis family transcriptional regulator [Desulfatiglans sp.]
MEYPFIGNHPSIKKIRELVSMVSGMSLNVLLLGETGTGKDIIARYLHQSSPRKNNKFIKVNCAALPLSLLESELFGYEKGAFTGADKLKPGRFEQASDGIMFLDEIGDMPLPLQAKLLNVLQSGEYSRLGGSQMVKVNAWVISSTNHDLNKDIKEGRFREDLFYRLNVIKIEMPPLRERKEDIPLLVDHFIKKNQQELNMGSFSISPEIQAVFLQYNWPGNIRELSAFILRLMMGDNPDNIRSEIEQKTSVSEVDAKAYSLGDAASGIIKSEKISLKAVKAEAATYIEKKAIEHVLSMTNGNKVKTAKILKISYKTLFNKMGEGLKGGEAESSKLKGKSL